MSYNYQIRALNAQEMSQNLPLIQDKAIIAVMGESNPIGEALKHGTVSLSPMTQLERQLMVLRLEDSIGHLMKEAQKTYHENCYKPGTKEINGNYITRLSTNEFFFYTKEPLTLQEFEALQNKIAEKAKTMPAGVQLILGSFAVQTDQGRVMNVTPHISCGPSPDIHLLVKNHTSPIDVRYDIPNGIGKTTRLAVLDKDKPASPMPQIKINGTTRSFTFNNIIPCKTPNGTPFITAIDLCLDHAHGVANKNYRARAQKDPSVLKQPVSHVVISNCVELMRENYIGRRVMHVDPTYSLSGCQNKVKQKISAAQTNIFSQDLFKTVDLEAKRITKCISIKNNYAYKTTTPTNGRNHKAYTISLDKVQFKQTPDQPLFHEFKNKYQSYRGDYLKNQILENLKARIENTSSLKELDDLRKELKTSNEYLVLKTGQGWFSHTFKLETSSQRALAKMFEQQEENLFRLGFQP